MSKKALAIALAAATLLSTCISCSQEAAPSSEPGSSAASAGSSAAEESSGPQALEKEGKTITIYTSTTIGEDAKPDNGIVKEWIEEQLGYSINPIYVLRDNFGEK